MTSKATVLQGWTWTNTIGLMYGTGPNGERETVCRPLMSSPWWTIGDPDPLAGSTSHVYPDGMASPIFRTAAHAVRHVISVHPPMVDVEPTTSYEIWELNTRTHKTTRWGGNRAGGLPLSAVQHQVDNFNEDQKYHDRYEDDATPTKVYFIVETTTTYKTYEG